MPEKNTCEYRNNSSETANSICSKLSVVDETKSDMEYNCYGCINK